MPHFGHIEIFSPDPLRTSSFYSDILDFSLTDIQHEKLYWLKNGELELLIRPGRKQAATESYESSRIALVLYTTKLSELKSRLNTSGVKFTGNISKDKCLYIEDPDGNRIQLVDPNDY